MVFGTVAEILWARKPMTTCVFHNNTVARIRGPDHSLSDKRLSSTATSKTAGRLSFVATAAITKVGRPFIKPFQVLSDALGLNNCRRALPFNATLG